MKRKSVGFFFFCITGFLIVSQLSCSNSKYGALIPPKKFVSVLVDIHLADGIAINNMGQTDQPLLDSASLYQSVFSKYGVTRAMFDSTMVYYTQHPDEFLKVYNKVTARLKLMEDKISVEEEKKKPGIGAPIDTILGKGQGTRDEGLGTRDKLNPLVPCPMLKYF